MQIYLTSASQKQQEFSLATTLCETVTIILPHKEIVIDVQKGIVHDQPTVENSSLETTEKATKTPEEWSQADTPGYSDKQLQEWVNNFLKTKQLRWKPKTLSVYTSILNLYVAHVGANHWPPTYQGALRWLNHVKESNTETTVSTYWTHLQAFFNYLQKIGAIQPHQNPVHKIKELDLLPDRPDLPEVAFPADDLDRLFASLKLQAKAGDKQAIRDLALIRFAYVTGCRQAEIARLTLHCINMRKLEVIIPVETTKGKKMRRVYFDKYVQLDLQDWLAVRPDISGVKEVFVSLGGRGGKGRPMKPRALYDILQRRLLEVKLARRKFHALRHSSVLDALEEGISVEKVQKQLGHASIQTTMAYMRGRDPERAQAYRTKSLLAGLSRRVDESRNEDDDNLPDRLTLDKVTAEFELDDDY